MCIVMSVTIIILAAGDGSRMCSKTPKVLHTIGEKKMLFHSISLAKSLGIEDIRVVVSSVVYSEIKDEVKGVSLYIQKNIKGTAGAVRAALKDPVMNEQVLVLYADVPNIQLESLKLMKAKLTMTCYDLNLLVFSAKNPEGYGRVIVKSNLELDRIVEDKDVTFREAKISLCNAGMMMVRSAILTNCIGKIGNNNAQKEFYLTDLVRIVRKNGGKCGYFEIKEVEALGVNSMEDLAIAEKNFQDIQKKRYMKSGVKMLLPDSIYIAADVQISPDVVLFPNVYLGSGVSINSGTRILPFSYIEGVDIGKKCSIGPSARIRAKTVLKSNVKVGNFAEVKNSTVLSNSKISHQSYVGDSFIGERVNIGAGVVFCNFDGNKKHSSRVGNDVFIGANVSIISPIVISDRAFIAAGSVITKDVAEGKLVISGPKEQSIARSS